MADKKHKSVLETHRGYDIYLTVRALFGVAGFVIVAIEPLAATTLGHLLLVAALGFAVDVFMRASMYADLRKEALAEIRRREEAYRAQREAFELYKEARRQINAQ